MRTKGDGDACQAENTCSCCNLSATSPTLVLRASRKMMSRLMDACKHRTHWWSFVKVTSGYFSFQREERLAKLQALIYQACQTRLRKCFDSGKRKKSIP